MVKVTELMSGEGGIQIPTRLLLKPSCALNQILY